jgi:trehalose-6-phosphate synthase
MRRRVHTYDVDRWAQEFLTALEEDHHPED